MFIESVGYMLNGAWQRLSLFVVSSILFFTGCKSLPYLPSVERQVDNTKNFELPATPAKGKALIYVVRPGHFMCIVTADLYLDSKNKTSGKGANSCSEYLYFEVLPGKHTLFSKTTNWSEITLEARAGDILFFEQEMGALIRNNLLALTEVGGRYRLNNASNGMVAQ